MTVQLTDNIINNLFVRIDRDKFINTESVITLCKLSKLYIVLGGENVVFNFLRDFKTPHHICFIDMKVNLREFVRVDEIAHGKSDS